MGKQFYEKKTMIKIAGILDKNENGDYVVIVNNKDFVDEYDLKNILDEMLGTFVTFQNEETL